MEIETGQPSPLDYQTPRVRRPPGRSIVVTSAGAAVALVGVIVFLCAHAISTPAAGVSYNTDDRLLRELLWAAFGIALLLVGGLIAAVGLASWCRKDAG
jgi:hypothetical protein